MRRVALARLVAFALVAVIVAVVALALPVPARAEEAPAVYVELGDSAELSALAQSVAHILVSAGLPVTLGRGGADPDRFVRITLRRDGGGGIVIEASHAGRSWHTTVVLPATASAFDQTHALAIEVELLVDEARRARPAPRPRPPGHTRPPLAAAPAASPPAPGPAPPTPPAEAAAEPPAAATPPTIVRPRFVVVRTSEPGAAAPPRPERLAFQASLISLGDLDGDFMTYGFALAVRVALGQRFDVRLSAAILDADQQQSGSVHVWRKVNPLALYGTFALPVPGLRVGAGVETVSIVGLDVLDDDGDGGGHIWSTGALANLEYRRSLGIFAACAGVAFGYHPFHERLLDADADRVVSMYPRWTIGLSLGLEFRLR